MTLGTALVNCKLGPAPIDTFRKDGRTQLRPGCGRRFVSRPIAVGDFAEIQHQRMFFEPTESSP